LKPPAKHFYNPAKKEKKKDKNATDLTPLTQRIHYLESNKKESLPSNFT